MTFPLEKMKKTSPSSSFPISRQLDRGEWEILPPKREKGKTGDECEPACRDQKLPVAGRLAAAQLATSPRPATGFPPAPPRRRAPPLPLSSTLLPWPIAVAPGRPPPSLLDQTLASRHRLDSSADPFPAHHCNSPRLMLMRQSARPAAHPWPVRRNSSPGRLAAAAAGAEDAVAAVRGHPGTRSQARRVHVPAIAQCGGGDAVWSRLCLG